MDASILLIGSEDFLSTLLTQIRNLVSCTVEVAANPSEAVPLIQAQQPDLLIVQGSQPGSLELFNQIKEQPRLAWIYCILLDTPAQVLETAWSDRAWEVESKAEALENGADAYLWLPQNDSHGKPLLPEEREQQERGLRAQIMAGLRLVRTHRELMRTNDILSAIALSDPLTELNNRRALDWELPRQVQNARSRAEPLSVLMLDIDFFKSINDTYGHSVGDRALQLVSSRLRHNLRFRDTLFRYGGEEFVIILGCTDSAEALLVGQRLCRQVGDFTFSVDEDLDLSITVSAGTATLFSTDDSRGNSVLKRADQNLLRAKAAGRNQVIGSLEQEPELEKSSEIMSDSR